MKPQELRIGNLVICDGNVTPVVYITNDNTEWLEPIPLTEEWLVKFRFELDDDIFSKGRFHVDLERGMFYSGNDHVSSGNADAKIKYVHQLQNLYFALVGEELELSPVPK